MPAFHHSVFTGWMPFLPPNQQHQSTEGGQHHKQTSDLISFQVVILLISFVAFHKWASGRASSL